jgi:pimeloyl-ACP methyl ester carboxylesterase
MRTLLRDVHHYLFNTAHSPRAGDEYLVQDEIRRRTIEALKEGAAKPGRHVVVSHSMGTVIAYDCLKRVPGCPAIDALMTIGSPLGLDEIQEKCQPEWTREDGYPYRTVPADSGKWVNVFDRLDPVAGLDPVIANDYQRSGRKVIKDVNEQNHGNWRHNITKYLGGAKLRAELGRLLGF